MATATRKALVSSDYQLLPVEDMSGGIDLRRSPSLMQPTSARGLVNYSLEEPGALIVFPGWASFSTTSLGNGRPQGGQRIYLGASTFTLVGWSGAIYKPTDSGVWGANVLGGLSTSAELYFPYDRNLVAVLDGAHVPQKSTNGTTWTQMGINAPLAAPTLSAVAGGSLITGDTYAVSYSYYDDELAHESNESTTASQAVSGSNLTVRVAVIASTDPQVDKIRVYVQDTTLGQSVRRLYTTVANTTQNVDVTANTWETATEAPSNHTVALGTFTFAVVWKNRWWFVTGNRLYFSQIFQPQSVPPLFYIEMPFEQGDSITAVQPQGDTLVVFGQSSKPFLIIGQTSLDFEVRPAAGGEAGALGPRAVASIENGILHCAAEGVYVFDGATDRLLTNDIEIGWKSLINGSSTETLGRVACIYHAARKEVRITAPTLYPYSTAGEWVLDLNRTRLQTAAAWTATDRTIGGYIVWRGNEAVVGNRGRLFSWSRTIGKLYEEAVGTSADGSDLTAVYVGPTLTTGLYSARIIDGYVEYGPNAGTFSIETLVDGVSQGMDAVTISGGLSVYNTAKYSRSTYGGKNRSMSPFTLPLESEGRSVLLQTTYVGQARFRQYTYAFGISPESAARGL